MSLYKDYSVNSDKAENGVAVQFKGSKNKDGSIPTFYVRQIGRTNSRYLAAVDKAVKPLRRQYRNKGIPAEEILKANTEAFIATGLVRWENVCDRDGKPIPYSKEAALKFFGDLPALAAELEGVADDMTNFQDDEEREEDAKNS